MNMQYAFGISSPTRRTFYLTGGRAPFKPVAHTPNNTNEPYLDVSAHSVSRGRFLTLVVCWWVHFIQGITLALHKIP
jgi:tripeptidyl-peptidase-1